MAPSWVADNPVLSLRKLMAMLSSGRTGFRREFLEINGIERHHSMHTVRTSPTNEGFREVIPAVLRVPSIAEKMVPSNERIYTQARFFGSSYVAICTRGNILW